MIFNLASTLLKVLWSQWSLLDHVYARIFRRMDDASISNICGKIVEPFQIVFSIKCKVFCKNCNFWKIPLCNHVDQMKFLYEFTSNYFEKQTLLKKSNVTNCIYHRIQTYGTFEGFAKLSSFPRNSKVPA